MRTVLAAAVTVVMLVTPSLQADWNPGDPYKMHFPQLPDPAGWAASVTWGRYGQPITVADDWECSETGYVSDVHFWFAWDKDVWDYPYSLSPLVLQIYDNDTSGNFSKPGNLLWERVFSGYYPGPAEYAYRLYDASADQGFFVPYEWSQYPNHSAIYQANITNIQDPFLQEQGETYWLAVQRVQNSGLMGWSTSLNTFQDGAVWNILTMPWEFSWTPLGYDMAFVITGTPIPEPASLAIWGLLAGAGVWCSARRARSRQS